ncbi:hypothetical protein [Baekduia sp. Peel2402]|uniref:hypothetical protein n=1 Tax=Baekduia sp. Peel2402 TaxID=3458296 RepID=UPI00403EE4D4
MSDTITWLSGVSHLDANPAATVALDRARWEALGATFVEVDDGDDETPGLAVGQVDGIDFGVLDYGEGETYLLVPGSDLAPEMTVAVLRGLEAHQALDVRADLVDVVGTTRVAAADAGLAARLDEVERRLSILEHPAHEPIFGAVAEVAEMYPAASGGLIHNIARTPKEMVISGQLPLDLGRLGAGFDFSERPFPKVITIDEERSSPTVVVSDDEIIEIPQD